MTMSIQAKSLVLDQRRMARKAATAAVARRETNSTVSAALMYDENIGSRTLELDRSCDP